MTSETRLVHFQVIGGTQNEIKVLSQALGELKKNLPNYEFLITNDRVRPSNLNQLIRELFTLYKKQKEKDIEVKK